MLPLAQFANSSLSERINFGATFGDLQEPEQRLAAKVRILRLNVDARLDAAVGATKQIANY